MSAPRTTLRVRVAGTTIAAAMVLGLVLSACGGAAGSRIARAVHFDGQATGDYVREISASGTTFLLPVADVAHQDSRTFDVVDAA
jgi:hypothetical protein